MVDTQAAYESMMTFMSSMNYGINFLLHCAGLLENYMTMSYEKFIIDEEILGLVDDCQSNIVVNKETVAKEVISEVGAGGHYLTESHTLNHMKDFRTPIISRQAAYTSEEDLVSTAERANEKWKSILADFKAPYLDPIIEKKLKEYMEDL
jgi:trimethylamine--corrinoid protein Co-methyltransferase